MKRSLRSLSAMQLLVIGFFVLILIGTGLLMLPFSSADGLSAPFLTALFTSTSASCVTGLTLVDTSSQWSAFGKIVLLLLIQIGGLGFITFGTTFTLLFRRKLNLKQRGRIRESLNVSNMENIYNLVFSVIKGTAFFESLGAVILFIRFLPTMGVKDGLFNAVFHSVSAFCNAGFDILGKYRMSSFSSYKDDPVVVITICLLILIGGIGFFVWNDISNNKFNFKNYSLHSKIVLFASIILIFGGAALFFISEYNYSFSGMNLKEKVLSAFFCSVTPRTAGFSIVNYGDMSECGKAITILLMFIGGGSGSTAGGIKITTMCVILLQLRSTMARSSGVNVFKRRLPESTIDKSFAVVSIYLAVTSISVVIINAMQDFSLGDTIFEVVSAVCTVGVTTGITTKLNAFSQIIIISLMYLGRLNSLSFALSFTDHKKLVHIELPSEEINIG